MFFIPEADRNHSRKSQRGARIRLVVEPLEDRCVPASFQNGSNLGLSDNGPAAIYPSNIQVSGLVGTVTRVTVQLHDFIHTFPDDLDMLLVVPNGTNVTILSDAGIGFTINGVFLTLDDATASLVPRLGAMTSGTFKPTNHGDGDTFPAPAPSPSGGSSMAGFNGINPNGTWQLFIVDDTALGAGVIDGGWVLTIETAIQTATNVTPMTNLSAGKLQRRGKKAMQSVTVTNNGDVPYANLVSLLLTGLKRKVKLTGATGTSAVFSAGSPFVSLMLGRDGDLDPGESVTFNLVFKNPTDKKFSFTSLVVAGLGAR